MRYVKKMPFAQIAFPALKIMEEHFLTNYNAILEKVQKSWKDSKKRKDNDFKRHFLFGYCFYIRQKCLGMLSL